MPDPPFHDDSKLDSDSEYDSGADTGPPIPDLESNPDLESLMAQYIERLEAGEQPDPSNYLRRFPQHAKELRSFFENHHWMDESPIEDLSDALIGKTIGRYRIEAEIARGGMGVVYQATQVDLSRPVALKVIRSGVLASREERKRFRIEAEATAKLHHPGILPIHEVGLSDGYHYFSMPLISGPTLQQEIDNGFDSPVESTRFAIAIADAVQFAHDAGILHRDLKPENVLLSQQGDPLLMDFGLAKLHQEGTQVTQTGQVLGTPHYMSPEQAQGHPLDVRSDVYSVGAIFYALLTGEPPHQGDTTPEVMRSVIQDDPISPRAIRNHIPSTLDRICEKAIAREASDRYNTAAELAEDLRRYREGSPVLADDSGLLGKMARELRRDQHQSSFVAWRKTLVGLGGIVFASHLAMGFMTWLQLPERAAFWGPRLVMFALLATLIYRSRQGQVLPRTAAERPIYSIWIGYLLSLATINLLVWTHLIPGAALFPISAALSGFGFVAMSGHVWGGNAILGLLFLAVALLMPLLIPLFQWIPLPSDVWMPVIFGGLWMVSLVVLSWHYRSREPKRRKKKFE